MSSRIRTCAPALLALVCALASGAPAAPCASFDAASSDPSDTLALRRRARALLAAQPDGHPFGSVTVVVRGGEGGAPPESRIVECEEELGGRFQVAAPVNLDSSRSPDARIARFARWRGGTLWTPDALERMERAALRTGYFVQTAPSAWSRVARRNLLRPEFSFRDAPTRSIQIELVSEEGNELPSGIFSLEWRNLFGTGRDLAARYRSTADALDGEVSWREPFLFARGPAIRATGSFRSEDTLWSALRGELALEWDGAWASLSLGAGAERVGDRTGPDGFEERDSWWGTLGAALDLRRPLPAARRGGVLSGTFSWRHPEEEEGWLLWGVSCDWLTRITRDAFALHARWRVARRWPWRAGLRAESAYDWGGANSLRGWREQALRSASYALFSLQPEWSATSSLLFFPLIDAAFDWTLDAPGTMRRLWSWGAGARWGSAEQRIGLAVAWPGAGVSAGGAVLHLSWESLF